MNKLRRSRSTNSFKNFEDSSPDTSLDKSVLKEYWDDFSLSNQVKPNKGEKFLDLDNPFTAALEKENQDFEKIKNRFTPENPTLLMHYDQLKEKYKLPSRRLLRLQKDEYLEYIEKLRNVARILVRRAKDEAKGLWRKFIIEKFKKYQESVEEESFYIVNQFLSLKEEIEQKEKYITQCEKRFVDQEKMLQHVCTLLSNAGIDYFSLSESKKDPNISESSEENENKGVDYWISLWKPFSLYSFQAPLLAQTRRIPDCQDNIYLKEENQELWAKIEMYEKGLGKLIC